MHPIHPPPESILVFFYYLQIKMFSRAPSALLSPFPKCLISPIFCAQRACGTRWGGRWSCHWGRESNWRSKQTRWRTEFWWVNPCCCCQPASRVRATRSFCLCLFGFSPERWHVPKLSHFPFLVGKFSLIPINVKCHKVRKYAVICGALFSRITRAENSFSHLFFQLSL